MLSPDEMDDLADAIDARCSELGDAAGDWMDQTFVEVLTLVPDPPAWFATCVEALRADWSSHSDVNELARKIRNNLDLEDGVRIDSAIAGRELRAHPYMVLGRQEADRQRSLANALQFATHGGAWGWDCAIELYHQLCDIPGMAQSTLDVYQKRLNA